jgi:hypothetical protein
MTLTTYLCGDAACTLGTVGQPGRFTGGITATQVAMVTGRPVDELIEGVDFGEGICPNCGSPATGTDGPTHNGEDE